MFGKHDYNCEDGMMYLPTYLVFNARDNTFNSTTISQCVRVFCQFVMEMNQKGVCISETSEISSI